MIADNEITGTITVSWTKVKFRKFKRAYQKAVRDNESLFLFDGNEFVVGYAKYLIQYVEERIK
jgi:hypothetical protein